MFDGTTREKEGTRTGLDPIAKNLQGHADDVVPDGIAIPSAAVTAAWSPDFLQRARESSTPSVAD